PPTPRPPRHTPFPYMTLFRSAHEFLISKDKNVLVHDGHVVNKGELIVDGPADPHDILRLLGIEALARYIVDEVQDVYRLQGVKRSEEHTSELQSRENLVCRPL